LQSSNETHALNAFLLNQNGAVSADTRFDAASLPHVAMPNREDAVADPPRSAVNTLC
jgi:S-disulfanyl-L-cysteine oxidoreductase SoxD